MWLPLNAAADSVSSTVCPKAPQTQLLAPRGPGGPAAALAHAGRVGAGHPRGCCEGPCQPGQGDAPGRCRALPPARVLLGFRSLQGSGQGPPGCYGCIGTGWWQRTHLSAFLSDVSYNLPACRMKLMMVFRADDLPGDAGGRWNMDRFGAMPVAFHRCPAPPTSPPAISKGRELSPECNLLRRRQDGALPGQPWSCPAHGRRPAEAKGCGTGCSWLAAAGEVSPAQHPGAPAFPLPVTSSPSLPHTHVCRTLLSTMPKQP